MKLYYAPGACSLAVHIAAREAGIPVELVKVDLFTHKLENGTDFYGINPRGYVPALELDDGTLITEVSALLQYLADLNPTSRLMPAAGTLKRVHAQSWLGFVATELHKVFSPWLWHKETAASTVQTAKAKLALRFKELDALLATQEHLLGAQFAAPDAYAFAILNWCGFLGISLNAYPALKAYLARIAQRPAVQAVLEAEGLLGVTA